LPCFVVPRWTPAGGDDLSSCRLPEHLLEQLERKAQAGGTSLTSLVVSLVDEGINTRHFPGSSTAMLLWADETGPVAGPVVSEIIQAAAATVGRGENRVRAVPDATGLPVPQIRLPVEFYATKPGEIVRRIEVDEREAERVGQRITRRDCLLSP